MRSVQRLARIILAAALLVGCTAAPTPAVPANPAPPDPEPEPPLTLLDQPVVARLTLPDGRLLVVGTADPAGHRPVGLVAGGALAAVQRAALPGAAVAVAAGTLPGHADTYVLTARREQGELVYAAVRVAGDQLQVVDYYAATAPQPESTTGVYLHVNKHLNRLWLFRDGQLVKHYPVATGRQTTGPPPTLHDYSTNYFTPEGRFTIATKVINPLYYGGPDHPPAAGGAPDNPLGTRWLGFVAVAGLGPEVWGIHGTNEPDRIGTWASDGCVRMHNQHVEELAALVPVGAALHITGS